MPGKLVSKLTALEEEGAFPPLTSSCVTSGRVVPHFGVSMNGGLLRHGGQEYYGPQRPLLSLYLLQGMESQSGADGCRSNFLWAQHRKEGQPLFSRSGLPLQSH